MLPEPAGNQTHTAAYREIETLGIRRTSQDICRRQQVTMVQADKDEFMRLLVTHERHVHAFILTLLPAWSESEEVLQNTMVRLCQQMAVWDSRQDFRAWACTVARYEVLSYRKSLRRNRLQFCQEFIDAVAERQSRDPDRLELLRDALEACRAKLKPAGRRLLDLAYRGDLKIEQVAAQTSRSVASTYKLLLRVRQQLHECIERRVRLLER